MAKSDREKERQQRAAAKARADKKSIELKNLAGEGGKREAAAKQAQEWSAKAAASAEQGRGVVSTGHSLKTKSGQKIQVSCDHKYDQDTGKLSTDNWKFESADDISPELQQQIKEQITKLTGLTYQKLAEQHGFKCEINKEDGSVNLLQADGKTPLTPEQLDLVNQGGDGKLGYKEMFNQVSQENPHKNFSIVCLRGPAPRAGRAPAEEAQKGEEAGDRSSHEPKM